MTFTLRFADHGEAIGNAVAVIRNNLAATGLDRPVPTTPGWTTQDLLVHSGVTLRWIEAVLAGAESAPDEAALAVSLEEFPDPLDWLDDSVVDALNALVTAPADSHVRVLLENGPSSAREAWARFGAHELTVHAIDAMAARLGRAPSASELWIAPPLALDGIDHHLRGFVPRWERVLRTDTTRTLSVLPDDTQKAISLAKDASDADLSALEAGWTVTFGPDGARTELGAVPDADATVRGQARGILAALWNRGDDLEIDGDRRVFAEFRDRLRIT